MGGAPRRRSVVESLSAPVADPENALHQRILLQALDQLDAGLALYGASGELLYRNRSLRCLLDDSSHRSVLRAALEPLVEQMSARARARTGSEASPAPSREEQIVRDGPGTFRLHAVLVGGGGEAEVVIVVTLEQTVIAPPMEQRLREEFRLTSAQCSVALLLAEGRSNRKIAAELRISPHTASNHTKAVLGKLGLTSRAQVAAALRRLLLT